MPSPLFLFALLFVGFDAVLSLVPGSIAHVLNPFAGQNGPDGPILAAWTSVHVLLTTMSTYGFFWVGSPTFRGLTQLGLISGLLTLVKPMGQFHSLIGEPIGVALGGFFGSTFWAASVHHFLVGVITAAFVAAGMGLILKLVKWHAARRAA